MDKNVDWSDAAFPSAFETQSSDGEITKHFVKGLSKREYFAAMAMQAMVGDDPNNRFSTNLAVKFADALIKSLEKTNDDKTTT